MVELNVDSNVTSYDVARDSASGLLIGERGENGQLVRLSDQGQQLGSSALTPLAGYDQIEISDLSEDGRWAVGNSVSREIDPSTGFVTANYALTLWNLSDPTAPVAIALPDPDSPPLEKLTDLSNLGTFIAGSSDGRIFQAGPTGIQPLPLPAGTPLEGSIGNWFQPMADITADGTTFVGSTRIAATVTKPALYSPGLKQLYQADVWQNGQPTALPVQPETLSSQATSITDDGRLIGGNIASESDGQVATVWFDRELRTFHAAAGQLIHGGISFVINGLNGDPHQWLAFGWSYNHDFPEVTFVAGPDGVAHPLTQWLETNYGFTGDVTHVVLDDLQLADGQLRLFTAKNGIRENIPPGSTLPIEMIPTGTQMITIDLSAQTYDLDSDGAIAASDVLLVINALNNQLAHGVTDGSLPVATNSSRLDLSHDGHLTAEDALILINRINAKNLPLSPKNALLLETTGDSDQDALAADLIYLDLAQSRRTT
jgi:hypothetical protein